MRSYVDENQTREILIKTSLLLLAVALNAVEFVIPRIPLFPWLKPGLANIVTLVWIVQYGFGESLLYAMVRVWIVSFYFGFSFVAFLLGGTGAVCACLGMYLCWCFAARYKLLGYVGIAVVGAVFHNMGQLVAVYFIMAKNAHLFFQIPVMISASILFGAIVGIVSPMLLRATREDSIFQSMNQVSVPDPISFDKWHLGISAVFFLLCMVLVFIEDYRLLLIFAAGITIFAIYITRKLLYTLLYPVRRFWLLFLFIGIIHLFFSYGIAYKTIPFITHEGLQNTVIQWLRLWAWIQTTFIFTRYGFNGIILKSMRRLFPQKESTLYAGLLAVEYFPDIIDMLRGRSVALLGLIFRNPSTAVTTLFKDIVDTIASKQTKS